MKPHTDTLNLIRNITEDGRITENEVMALGNYLNTHDDARKAWPGHVLFEVLKHIYEDGQVDQAELKALGLILRGIELQCTGTFGVRDSEIKDEFPADMALKVTEIELPPVDYVVTVKAPHGDAPEYDVNLTSQECGCDDWKRKRAGFPFGSPGRLCKHMLFATLDSSSDERMTSSTWHRSLLKILNYLAKKDRTTDAFPNWELLQVGGRDWIIAWGRGEWSVVFTTTKDDEIDRYAYNLNESRWAYGKMPIGVRAIQAHFVKKSILQPANVPGK
jgi:hypothetical protein